MQILQTATLSGSQVHDIRSLETMCRIYDHNSLTFPIEDGSLYFLLYEEETLLSVFSAFFNGSDAWECSAFTRPAERRKGYFTSLLDRFLEENKTGEDEEEFDLVFAVDESCDDTVKTLNALGAVRWYREYLMALPASAVQRPPASSCFPALLDAGVSFNPPIGQRHLPGNTAYQIMAEPRGVTGRRIVGSFHLDFRSQEVYFYGFEIHEEFRGQGLGSRSFYQLLERLSQLESPDLKPIVLQVSEDNRPALSIYEKAGFQIAETLSYYVY